MKDSQNITYLNSVNDIYPDSCISNGKDQGFMINSLLDVIQSFPHKSGVYRANYYSFLFIKEGKGNYTMDDKTFEYGSNVVYFANPGHIKSHEFYHLKDAYRITLTEEFLKANVHKDIFEDFPFY